MLFREVTEKVVARGYFRPALICALNLIVQSPSGTQACNRLYIDMHVHRLHTSTCNIRDDTVHAPAKARRLEDVVSLGELGRVVVSGSCIRNTEISFSDRDGVTETPLIN